MSGGAGDDTYIVDSSSDSITENESEGTDLFLGNVYSDGKISTQVRLLNNTPDNVENLKTTETTCFSGNAGNDTLLILMRQVIL